MCRHNGILICIHCTGKIRVCRCSGSKPPKVGGNNEKCPSCGGWKLDDASWWEKFLRWLASIISSIKRSLRSYTLTDWLYFFKYFFTSYHLECADSDHMTSREFFIHSTDSMFKGTFKAANEREREVVANLYLWSFFGMRFAFFVGNNLGVDKQNEYCPVALYYPFLGRKEVCIFPRNLKTMRTVMMGKDFKSRTYEWSGEQTYFPEPNDDFSHAAEKFAVEYLQAVHAGKDEEKIRDMMLPGSPIASLPVESLRRKLPNNGLPGRASSPWSDTRLVPFLIIEGKQARAVRLLVEKFFDKMYVTEIH